MLFCFKVTKFIREVRTREQARSSIPESALMTANKSLSGNALECGCSELVKPCNLKGLQSISLYYMYV